MSKNCPFCSQSNYCHRHNPNAIRPVEPSQVGGLGLKGDALVAHMQARLTPEGFASWQRDHAPKGK